MRFTVLIALSAAFSSFAASDQLAGDKPKKPVKAAAILDDIPEKYLASSGVWSADDVLEVNKHLKQHSPGYKMIIQLDIAKADAKEQHVALVGPITLQEFKKVDFRGRELILLPKIQNQIFLAMPLKDQAALQNAPKGSSARLLATTALLTLDKANVEVFFDGTLGKTVLLEVLPVK